MIIVGLSKAKDLARKIARHLKAPYSELKSSHFPDGETNLRFMTEVKGKETVLVNSFHPQPNEAMIETIFAAETAKELGAKSVVLVVSYLAYMRQDKRFHPGECQSNKIMAKLMSVADKIITVDPHLHRINSLNEIFKIKTVKLSANQAIADYIKKNIKNELIVGPDIESYQWAETIAEKIHLHAMVLKKKRYTAEVVRIKVKGNVDFKGKNVVIVDDMISTGHTIMEPAKQIKKKGAKKIYALCVHGLFVEGALEKMKKMGIEVLTTNTVENPAAKIDLSGVIAQALK